MSETTTEEIYHATIMERARRPRHHQLLAAPAVVAEERNRLCGDRIVLHLGRDAEGRISAVGYQARACAICMAAADLMAEVIPGMTEGEARQAAASFEHSLQNGGRIEAGDRLAPLAVFEPLQAVPSRIRCALLPFKALEKALDGR